MTTGSEGAMRWPLRRHFARCSSSIIVHPGRSRALLTYSGAKVANRDVS
jgi:hypothetical protein